MRMWYEKKKIWISVAANWNDRDRNELQWNHVKIENSSWQPTQQSFYFRFFLHFDWKFKIGERITSLSWSWSWSGGGGVDRHSIFNRFGKLISYCHSLSVLDYCILYMDGIGVCVWVLGWGFVSICCCDFASNSIKLTNIVLKSVNKTFQIPSAIELLIDRFTTCFVENWNLTFVWLLIVVRTWIKSIAKWN